MFIDVNNTNYYILLNIFDLSFINNIYDYLIICYTFNLNFIGKITRYYIQNQVWLFFIQI